MPIWGKIMLLVGIALIGELSILLEYIINRRKN